jgi:hypothetical protein
MCHPSIYMCQLYVQMTSCLYQCLSSMQAICIYMCQPSVPMCNLAVPICKLPVLVCQRFVPLCVNHLPKCNFLYPWIIHKFQLYLISVQMCEPSVTSVMCTGSYQLSVQVVLSVPLCSAICTECLNYLSLLRSPNFFG